MKKIALYILAAAAVFAGCSKNDVNTTPVDPEDAWMYDATLPVPIRLGANATSLTKGAQINTLEQMDGKTFGFYAVNSGKDSLITGNQWSVAVDVNKMPLGASENDVIKGVKGVYNVETNRFDFEGGPYFYDQTDWTPYTFYGYYAHVEDDTNPDYSNGKQESVSPRGQGTIFVRIGVGHTDILWGKAEAESVTTTNNDICYGFNAPYLRNKGPQPVMKFKHMTACVSFKVQQVGTDKIKMNIDSVIVENAPIRANLVIASKDVSKEGKFSSALDYGEVLLGGMPQEISTDSKALGNESLFLYPQESYNVRVVYSYGNSKEDSYTAELKPVTKVKDELGNITEVPGFLPGYHYTYNFKVYSPEEIVIEAEIEPYKPAFGDDVWQDYDPEEYM